MSGLRSPPRGEMMSRGDMFRRLDLTNLDCFPCASTGRSICALGGKLEARQLVIE